MKKAVRIFSLLGAAVLGAAGLCELTFGVLTVNHIHGLIFFKDMPGWVRFLPSLAALFLLFCGKKKLLLYEYAFRPLWLMGALFFWPSFGTGMMCYALLVVTWTALRFGALNRTLRKIPPLEGKYAVGALAVLTLAAWGWCWFLQSTALDGLYLIYGDWGQYAECYMRFASGEGSWKQWLSAAGHLNILVNLIMAGAFLVSASAHTVFAVNALVIVSAIPLSFILARCCRLGYGTALLCAFLAAIFPIYTRQTLSLFYGFHPIVFFIPLLLGFFIARSKGSVIGMTICCVLSLLVQETVAIFWIGWGVYLFLVRKRYLGGALLALGMAGLFAFFVLFLQPWCAEAQTYVQSFRYAALGDTPLEIALSPIKRPGLFWSAFFSPRNFLFTFIILSPLFFTVMAFPGVLAAGLPLLAGFYVQSSDDVKTPLLQYGVELGTLCWALAIVNLGRVKNGELCRWRPRGNFYYGILCAAAAGVVLGYIFFGFGFKFGLYPAEKYFHRPSAVRVLVFLKKHIPRDASRLLVAGRVRGHFMFDYNTADLYTPFKTGDWVLLDLQDPVFDSPDKIEPLRHRLYRFPGCTPVTYANWYGKHLVLLHLAPPGTARNIVPRQVPEELFKRANGILIPANLKDVQAKYDGRMIHFRIMKKLNADYDVFIKVTLADGQKKTLEYSWFFGLFPAWSQKTGTLWSVPMPQNVVRCALFFKERPGSALSAMPAAKKSSTPQGRGN